MEKVELSVLGISYNHTKTGAYALLLSEKEGIRRVPIIIGAHEAHAIAIHMEGFKPPRPLTHDLFVSFSEAYNVVLKEVLIYKMTDGVFYSEILFDNEKNRIRIDSRTSDAIALAVRFNAPVYIDKKLLSSVGLEIEIQEEDEESIEIEINDEIPGSPLSPDNFFDFDFEEDDDVFEDSLDNDDGISIEEFKEELTRCPEEELNDYLSRAIEHEDYETADLIQQEINRRTKK